MHMCTAVDHGLPVHLTDEEWFFALPLLQCCTTVNKPTSCDNDFWMRGFGPGGLLYYLLHRKVKSFTLSIVAGSCGCR